MNRKIGIATFHYADNHGAVLQAYALRRAINSFSDCQAEIINYVPRGYRYPVISGSGMLEGQKRKREKFNRFLTEQCGIHTPMIHSITGNVYDVYLVGSDQVWNTELMEVSADYEYFLPHLNEDAKRIAFSASIGMDPQKIDNVFFKQYLSRFDSISLREKNCLEKISDLAGKKCEITLDPSMLLTAGDYEALTEKPCIPEKPYLLYFWYDLGDGGMNSIETVNTLARKYDLTVLHTFFSEGKVVRRMLVHDGGCMIQEGIEGFLWYIRNAQVIVTNSFHGAVFSILFEKPLYIFYPEIRKSRQETLVELFRLQSRVIKGYVPPDRLNLEMDYSAISEIMQKERKKSIDYLRSAIETA